MVWVRTEFGTPEDGPLWKTEAERSWLTWLSFFYQRYQSAGPLPQSSSLRLCGQFLHWLRWEVPDWVRGQWRGRFRVTNLYLRNIRRVVLWAHIHASHNNNLLCCVLKCVTSKAINGRFLFQENYLCYISLLLYFQQVVAKSSNALRFFF